MKPRRVLFLVANFPPVGGVGVIRAAKMAKYLPAFGFEVEVVTTDPQPYLPYDESLVGDVEGAAVHRVQALFPHASLLKARSAGLGASVAIDESSRSAFRRMIRASGRAALKYTAVPDAYAWWSRKAAGKALSLARRRRFDVIWSTHQPASAHLAAAKVAATLDIPWVADYRDPWTWSLMYEKPGPIRLLESSLERRALRRAAAIVTVTEGWRERFAAEYGHTVDRIELIYNGFDPADFPPSERRLTDGRLVLAYTGSFHWRRTALPLLEGLALALKERTVDRSRITIRFAGRFDPPGSDVNTSALSILGLTDVVQLEGRLPHRQATDLLATADVLVDIGLQDAPDHLSAKLFEYIGARRPILGIHQPGESSRLIEQNKLGWVVRPDPRMIARMLARLQREGVRHRVPDASIEMFDRKEQAGQLARLFDAVIARRRPDGLDPRTSA